MSKKLPVVTSRGGTVEPPRLTPAPPPGRLIDSPRFPAQAKVELGNPVQRKNLHHAMTTIRDKRARVAGELDNWEDLRLAGEAIKNRTLRHLDTYLVQLEENLTAAGTEVHWARDAEEANRIIVGLVEASLGETREVVKIKSMATQEIDMNEALEEAGIAAWETDLAELIVQLGHDRPSHILVPAIHRNRSEVREIFNAEMGTYGRPAPEGLDTEPKNLAGAARLHLREKFLRSKVAISGANFMVADTGTLVIVESEGNGRMCLTLADTLISVVGIEKIVPSVEDLEVFLQLLPRSSTGERMNPYTSMWTGPASGDGPQTMHVVLIDNGRTQVLSDPKGREALRCIRCSACINVCPVYEKVGGHAYGSVYPGPIGAVLTPQLRGVTSAVDASLPYASTLCGACFDVCPVRIPLPDLLVHMRHKVVEGKKAKGGVHTESAIMKATGRMFSHPRLWAAAVNAGALGGKALTGRVKHFGPLPWPLSKWTNARDVPIPPTESFRAWYARTHHEDGSLK
ncbi:LutB/LldF family L-lactate oxidation iron-sulfur protein [Propioniciclava tarda]|uniref:Iron-sulfur cluster-binding protein n=1 Tax=Propioniciclava tarda TaxID=433330 RepID=A0A4Q9KJD7_PROTD|nr:LutB/LldF family L-lactate oxidation iron-sulfur protein [Propioniciclava tarda]TBT94533.1 iron-sulfur cluster-binding protein [Propioniciclava tarda]SMO68666.1 L-lactate dehydrogenase complex protein LldF [Propioniciclava tarda]